MIRYISSALCVPRGRVPELADRCVFGRAHDLAKMAFALQIDELIFAADGTGTARFKAEPFVWSIAVDGHLEVEFSGGDAASYFKLEAKDSGNFVALLYRYAGGDVQRALSFIVYQTGSARLCRRQSRGYLLDRLARRELE